MRVRRQAHTVLTLHREHCPPYSTLLCRAVFHFSVLHICAVILVPLGWARRWRKRSRREEERSPDTRTSTSMQACKQVIAAFAFKRGCIGQESEWAGVSGKKIASSGRPQGKTAPRSAEHRLSGDLGAALIDGINLRREQATVEYELGKGQPATPAETMSPSCSRLPIAAPWQNKCVLIYAG